MRARMILPLALALITAGSTASSSLAMPSTPVDSSSPAATTSCHSIGYSGLATDPETLVLNCGTTADWPFAQPNGPTSAGFTINHIVFVSQTSEARIFITTDRGTCPVIIRQLKRPDSTTHVLNGYCHR